MECDTEQTDKPNKTQGKKTVADLLEHLKPTEVSISDFTFLSTIGGGASSQVNQALHTRTGIICAVKKFKSAVMEGHELKNYIREAKILAKCRNYFLLPYYGVSFNAPYIIVTKYIKNGNLRDALHNKDTNVNLTPSNKTIIAFCVAAGMQYLHDHGVIHRDLKSLNILLDGKLFPHICDFGLSRIQTNSTLATEKVGTPSWMAPELFLSTEFTNKVDVYSFGILLWEMLTEMKPFAKYSTEQLILNVCQKGERPQIPKDCPDKLRNLIQSCWNQEQNRRPCFADIMNSIRSGKVWFPGTNSDDIDEFFDLYDSDYFNKKGKKSSPFIRQVKNNFSSNQIEEQSRSKVQSQTPVRLRKSMSTIQKKPNLQLSNAKSGKEEEEVNEISNFDIPEIYVTETDVSFATTSRIKTKLKKKQSMNFDFDDLPEAVPEIAPETVKFENTDKSQTSGTENDSKGVDKSNERHTSEFSASPLMKSELISVHPNLETIDDENEEEDDGGKGKKSATPPHVSKFDFDIIPPLYDSDHIEPVPLVFTTSSNDRPKMQDVPASPYAELLRPKEELNDPLEYQYPVKPIPEPSVFQPPLPPQFDSNGEKVNIFLHMEAPESRGRTTFGRTNTDILLDYNRPSFEATFLRTMWQLTRYNARDFFSTISVLFTPPVPLYISQIVLKHCLRCLDDNQNAWGPFARSDAATALPFATPCLFDLSARIFMYVIQMNPDAMTPETTKQIIAMAKFKIQPVMKIFSVYVASMRFISNPWPVIDIFVDQSEYIMLNCGTIPLIRILFFLLKRNEQFRSIYEEKCLNIFAQALYTADLECAAVSFSAIYGLDDTDVVRNFELPNEIIAFHLQYVDIRNYCISYIAKKGKVPIDQKIVSGLIKASKTNETAALLLCKVAEDEEGAKMLLKNTQWMDSGYLELDNSFRIFSIIFKKAGLRQSLVDSQYFEAFLSRLVTSSEQKYISCSAFIIANIKLSFAVVERLRSRSFLTRFFSVVATTNEKVTQKGAIIACRKILEIEYCDEMSIFIINWSKYMADKDLIDDALDVAVKLTEHQEGIEQFKLGDASSVIEKANVPEKSAANRDLLLSRIS